MFNQRAVFRLCLSRQTKSSFAAEKFRISKFRHFSSSGDKASLANDEKDDDGKNSSTPSFGGISLRGVGQVIFLNSPASGSIILGGLAVGDPYLATLTLAGAATSTLSARIGGLDQPSLQDGLWGYNGALVGCVAAVFLHPLPLSIESVVDFSAVMSSAAAINSASWGMASTIMGASITPYVGIALREAMGGVPQWTIAFNVVALGALLRTQPFAVTSPASDETAADVSTTTMATLDQMVAFEAPLRGISQIFVVDSPITGGAIVGATALYSPGLAAHLLLGSAVGSATGYLLCGAPAEEIAMGLWGYNSALTSMGTGVFFVHSPRTMLLSAGGAAATAGFFGALKGMFGAFGAPCLTLPFCAAMSGCYLLGKGGVPGLALASSPHSPEKNS